MKDETNRVGLMHCYCLNQFINIQFQVINIKFNDGQIHCKDWFEKYSLANAFVYMVAAGIAILNISVKSLLRCKLLFII